MSKIVLIGANHAGTAAANTILDTYTDNELTILDRNSNISYLGCGTALYIGEQIDDTDGLFYSSPEKLRAKGATVHMETDVTQIDFDKKVVRAKDKDGQVIDVPYDKLIIATGSLPIIPKLEGMDLEYVHSVKLFQDGQAIHARLGEPDVKSVAVVGAGYIGVELAEAARRRGKEVRLFDVETTTLASYYDPWFTQNMDDVLKEQGVALHLGERMQALKGKDGRVCAIETDKGTYDADLAIICIGFVPNNILGKERLAMLDNGAYKVDLHQRTNLPDVYAIGDCASVYNNATQSEAYIALATNAVRSGIVAAHNACGTQLASVGVQGSNGISIYDYHMVSTGLNLRAAQKAGFKVLYTDYEDLQKPAFIKTPNHKVKIRIVYEEATRRILGAQMASYEDISMGIHMFSLAIEEQVTIDKLKLLDIFFLPHFNQPYNYITMAALSAK